MNERDLIRRLVEVDPIDHDDTGIGESSCRYCGEQWDWPERMHGADCAWVAGWVELGMPLPAGHGVAPLTVTDAIAQRARAALPGVPVSKGRPG